MEARPVCVAGESLVRFHVLANSDERIDQFIKYQVVERVRRLAAKMVEGAGSAENAYQILEKEKHRIERLANAALKNSGARYGARVETGVYEFPDRRYGERFVPGGDYRALRLVLGAGEGRNWWCVIYPSLCAVDAAVAAALGAFSGVRFESSLARALMSLFGGGGA